MTFDLQTTWFVLLGVLLGGYGVLDGFDLGVGVLHLFVREDEDRRILLNAIGPLWDGNEVWLVTFGGALFAAFPEAYATSFSGFYLPFMALLFCLIFRAVSIEFRSKHPSPRWRTSWDVAFCLASTVATFLFGLAIGNAMQGMPIGADRELAGTTSDLFRPYAVLVGLFAVVTCAMHGSMYLYLKTEGTLRARIHRWRWRSFALFAVSYVLVSIVTVSRFPDVTRNVRTLPAAWIIVPLNVLAIANIPRAIHLGRPLYAFVSSCATILALTSLFGLALFPHLLVSSLDPAFTLTIYNACSSRTTLSLMLTIALLGMPFVLAYTGIVYWVFRGKVKLSEISY